MALPGVGTEVCVLCAVACVLRVGLCGAYGGICSVVCVGVGCVYMCMCRVDGMGVGCGAVCVRCMVVVWCIRGGCGVFSQPLPPHPVHTAGSQDDGCLSLSGGLVLAPLSSG